MTVSKELTDKVLQRLTDNGTVSRLKAELRSNIFSLLKDTNAAQVAPSGRLAGKQKTQLDTQQGSLEQLWLNMYNRKTRAIPGQGLFNRAGL